MSFADSWSSAPGTPPSKSFGMTSYGGPSYQGGGNSDELLLQSISSNIRKITSNVASIKSSSDKIGTSKDSMQIRQEMRHLIDETQQIAKDTTTAMRNYDVERGPPESRQKRKQQQSRLVSDLDSVMKQFQQISKAAMDKEKMAPPPSAPKSHASLSFPSKSEPSWGSNYEETKHEEKQGLLRHQQLESKALLTTL